jgi:hypothetical protein
MLLTTVLLSLVVITLVFDAVSLNAIDLSCGILFSSSVWPVKDIKDIADDPRLVSIIRINRKDPNNNDWIDIELNSFDHLSVMNMFDLVS